MSDIAKRLADLSPEQLKHLLRRTRKSRAERSPIPVPHSRDIHEFPLSFAQQRLWFLYQWEPASPLYNLCLSMHLRGRLHVQALQEAITTLVQRHEVLHTTFTTSNGQPTQLISPSLYIPLPLVDLNELPEAPRTAALQRLVREEPQLPFDLEKGPVLRVHLLRLSGEEHILLLTLHHIISDGWSLGIFVRELALLYTASSCAEPSPLPALPLQYADYCLWQREWLQGEILERQLAYWKRQLEGAPHTLELPTDHPRPPMQTFYGRSFPFRLPGSLSQELKVLSRQQDVTLFMTMLAAWQILLSRYTGQQDILVGTPIANRANRALEPLMGCFVNTLVLRGRLAGDPSFQDFLGQVREMTLGAYEHQDLPFERLVEEVSDERTVSQSPLFQVLFSFLSPGTREISFADLRVDLELTDPGVALADISLSLWEGEEGINGICAYNSDLFEEATIGRLLGHYQVLLEGIVSDPQQQVGTLPLLRAAEREQMLMEWNAVRTDYSEHLCLHQLFEAQVQRTPEAVAAVFEDHWLTYSELNRRANQLAHHLLTLGVGPEVLVGICLHRSLEQVISLLAVLKAGGAYLPLDPTSPSERQAFLLTDARVSVLLTQEQLRPILSPGLARLITVLCLQEAAQEISLQPTQDPICCALPQHLAYVIYTSGSTGTPKGVMVTHGNVSRLFDATRAQFQFTAQDVWTLFHSTAFDFSVWELWGALLYGGRLVLLPYWLSRSPQAFATLLAEQRVTVLNQTPSAFRQLQSVAEPFWRQDLRLLIFGGEALDMTSVQTWWQQRSTHTPQLVNMYGITETTVHVTVQVLEATDLRLRSHNLIGRPLSDLQLYILDAHMQPVPVGVAGELYVGGAGLARGYLRQPLLTAERFVPHPWSLEPGSRLYKTGDLARLLADGTLEYLGRNDEQVKVRGFRIELGEIEAVLSTHPAIREAAVLAREHKLGDNRLVAYIVPSDAQNPTVNDIRGYLQARLPDYMLPSAVVFLETLPLTPNNKLDRRALPEPGPTRPDLEELYAPPCTPVEEILVDVWTQVLGLDQIGIHDNFFALGGDSIRSIQVLALARERGLLCSLQQIFQEQTIARLARVLSLEAMSPATQAPSQSFNLIVSEDLLQMPEGVEDAYPLTMLQAGMFFHSEYSPEATTYHDIFSLHLQAPLDLEVFRTAIQQLLARHAVLRTSFDLTTFSRPMQLVHRTVEIPLHTEDVRHLSSTDQENFLSDWIESEKGRRFDWSQAPLLRFQVFRRSEETFQLILSFHHAILDGWSVASLLTELLQRLDNEGSTFETSLMTQFRDFVALEEETLASGEAKRYWREKLSGRSSTPLPRRPSMQQPFTTPQPYVLHVPLSQEISNGLKALARSTGVPLKSVLLAAHLRVMSLLSGQQDVLTGLVANTRLETRDGERALGLFLNTLPHRQLLGGGSWTRLVHETFDSERKGLPFRRYPLAQIQQDQGGQSLFETAFNFIHFHLYERLRGLRNLQVLEGNSFDQTNFTLLANFSQDPASRHVHFHLECNASQLSLEQIEAIGGYYSRTLAAMATIPSMRYEQQSLLSVQEQQQMLFEWNATRTDYPQDCCLHQLFEQQVERSPEGIALVYEDEQLTYHELDQRANQLAHHLQALGVGPDVLVGLCLERSLELAVGLLAILKAGGAYVPLDPAYPPERLTLMLKDAQAPVLLTQHSLRTILPSYPGIPLCLDRANWFTNEPMHTPSCLADGQNLAYVIYTSGSTGRPKGVALPHCALTNLLSWHLSTLLGGARTLQFASVSFDASCHELFAAWATGGTVCMISEDLRRDVPRLAQSLITLGIEKAIVPVVTLQHLAQEYEHQHHWPQHLQEITTTGEQLHLTSSIRLWFRQVVHARLHNHYGPAESHVVTASLLEGDVQHWLAAPLIGRPIANTQIYILDQYGQPVPVGVIGELYVAGVCLARGYLGKADLTAERFVPHPWSQVGGERLYRTGDLARYQEDGTIEYLGRSDQQVKVRGYRIELGEIEEVLRGYNGVRDAVVLLREETRGDKQVVAYMMASPQPDYRKLRSYLLEKLPEYMVPSAFVLLDTFPLNTNGKIDRRALSLLEGTKLKRGGAYVAPRNPLEEALAAMWASLLRIEQVGIYDNFFELGGHSLLATQLISHVRKAFQVEVPLRDLLKAPSVAGLAEALVQHEKVAGQVIAIARLRKKIDAMSLDEIREALQNKKKDGKQK